MPVTPKYRNKYGIYGKVFSPQFQKREIVPQTFSTTLCIRSKASPRYELNVFECFNDRFHTKTTLKRSKNSPKRWQNQINGSVTFQNSNKDCSYSHLNIVNNKAL